ncbi:ATP-binding protein [Nonomuraea sediminis]|uniref:ATP-binding protein n=1 Tax=Nonomuraea sediminis TaxID=2835864 RepID=UPI0027E18381|nr:ATP-binding protein [Nonomuraea sediminis]
MSGHEAFTAGRAGPPFGMPITFRLPDLPLVRHLAQDYARRLGLDEETVGDLVIAVNEVATNAVTHGSQAGRLRTWLDGTDLVIEIHDDGTWKPGPKPGAVGGMGLWVARRLSAHLTVRAGAAGSTVVMRFPARTH